MRTTSVYLTAVATAGLLAGSAFGATIYNNLTPNNQMAMASRPGSMGVLELEAADDFVTTGSTNITSASFIGLLVPSANGGPTNISEVVNEIYRVFPKDSNTVRTPNVPTRANSPSDVAFDSRDSATAGQLTYTTTVLASSFTALNSVAPGGIHPSPNQTTGGNGSVTGQEVRIDVTFTSPITLGTDHFFFIPQVAVSGGTFYWLSAARPISGAGTTPFAPDLQAWIRDGNLDPDWLRVGTDIVGSTAGQTFNAAFSLNGDAVPEPSTALLLLGGLLTLTGLGKRYSRFRS